MQQVLIRSGKATAVEVPAPSVAAGQVLVRTVYSCLSLGTELASVAQSAEPLWSRLAKSPKKLKKAYQLASQYGLGFAFDQYQNIAGKQNPTGYSLAGIVEEIGCGVPNFAIGDRVACAGAQCAFHAEWVSVPYNLVAKLPDAVSFKSASTVSMGAIALQGLRRAQPTLGETIAVVGLGLIGQLTVQALRANGCRVIAIDCDTTRSNKAKQLGANHILTQVDAEQVATLTDLQGVDAAIITASTPDSGLINAVFSITRRKGRVVVVGDIGLNIAREAMYAKELDFYMATSYGPGRYDSDYEEQGIDYPLPYVRWTENRNMQAYLSLLAERAISVDDELTTIYTLDQAEAAFALKAKQAQYNKPLAILLDYGSELKEKARQKKIPTLHNPCKKKIAPIQLGIAGLGAFAQAIHLPQLKKLNAHFTIHAVMGQRGYNAQNIAKQYHAHYATTDYHTLLSDQKINAIVIATRHKAHSTMVLSALQAGKHVFVEKPLAMSIEELKAIEDFYNHCKNPPVLLTGFNRRFSPMISKIKKQLMSKTQPIMINYQINAGYVDPTHWTQQAEGGGRNLGEACHFYDLLNMLTGSVCCNISVNHPKFSSKKYSGRDNFIVTLDYEDGSVCNLLYTALGSAQSPKEIMTIYSEGLVITLQDYCQLNIIGEKVKKQYKQRNADKGYKQEWLEFSRVITQGGQWPISLTQQFNATQLALDVEQYLPKQGF